MGKATLTIAIGGEYQGKDAIKKAEAGLRSLREAARQAGGGSADIMGLGDSLVDIGSMLESSGQRVEAFGMKMTKLTAPIAAVGAASVKMAADYQDSVAKVYTIMDKSAMSTEEMSRNILDLSTATGKSADELADATYQALSASVSTEKVAGFVADAVKLSKVGFTDTATAVDTLTTVINAYGYSADDAAMITGRLVQTQNKGKTTVNELAQSMGNVIPTASAYNVSLDNLCSAYVIMTKQGINTANATTAINGMLTELANEGSSVAKILKDQTGKSFGQLMADGMDLGEVLQILNDSVDGDSEAFANLWGNVRASKGALAIANAGASEFTKAMGDMADSAGLVDEALDDLATPAAKARKALNAVKNTGIELGEEIIGAAVPSIERLGAMAQDLYKWFSKLDDGTRQSIVRFGALAVAAGPVVTIFGKGMQAAGSLATSIGKGVQTIGTFTAAMKTAEAEMRAAGATSVSMGTKMKAAAESTGIMTKATGLLRTALATIGITAVVALVGMIVEKYNEWKQHTELVEKATADLSSTIASGKAAYDSFTPSVEMAAKSVGDVEDAAKSCLQAQADLNDEVRSTWSEMGSSAAKVDHYAKIIEELGNKGELTAQEQFVLADAVQNFNNLTGSSVEVINAQTGELSTNADAVNALAEAWRKEAEAEALKEVYVKYTQQMIDDGLRLEEVTRKLNEANEGFGIWIGDFPVIADEASVHYHELQTEARDLEAAQKSAGDMAESAAQRIANSSVHYGTLGDALDACGVKLEDFGFTTDEQLAALEENFDGTLSSIVKTCIEQGGNIPPGLAQGIDSTFDKPVGSMEKLSNAVVKKAQSIFETHSPSRVMHKLGQDIDAGLGNGIDSSASKPTGSMSKLAEQMRRAVSDLPKYAEGVGSQSSAGMSSGIGRNESSVGTSARSVYSAAVNGISATEQQYHQTGQAAAYGFSNAIGSHSAYWDGHNLASSASSGLGSVDTYWSGYSFVSGFANGMYGLSLWSYAYNIGMNALSGLRSALGIASPSKEAMKVGEYFGEGAVMGMQSTEAAIKREVGRLGDIMALEPTPYGTFAAAGGYGPARRAERPSAVTMNVTINVSASTASEGKAVGTSLADALYEELSRKEGARLWAASYSAI